MKKKPSLLIAAFVSLVSILASIAAYTLFYADIKEASTQSIKRQQVQLTTVASAEIERYFYDILRRMEIIALMPEIRDAQRSEACNQRLQKIVEINSQEINNLGRVSRDGTFICAVNRTVIGEPVAKYGDYFQRVVNHPEHRPVMSRLIFPSGSASPVVAVHVPVYDASGKFNGTIGGAVYFDELQERLLAGTKPTKNSILAVYDNNLDVLANPDPLLRSKNLADPEVAQLYSPAPSFARLKEGIQRTPSEGSIDYKFRDVPRHATYKSAQVIDRHWTVLVAVPATDTDELTGYAAARNIFISLSGLAVIGITATAYFFARHSGTLKDYVRKGRL